MTIIKSLNIKNLTLSALFIALGIVLPFATMNIPSIGNMLLPMHIPVLLCGIVCSKYHGMAVGFILPFMRSFLIGSPPLFPNATAMAFELLAYGFIIGLAYEKLPKKNIFIYVSLFISLIVGRVVWGVTMFALSVGFNVTFSAQIFIAGAFANAIPGIILQVILIPTIIMILKKQGVLKYATNTIA